MKYLRVYADAEGESHFEDVEIKTTLKELVPGYPKLEFGELIPVSGLLFARMPPGMPDVERHPAPRRQFLTYLSGATEIEVSDGEKRVVGPHEIVLVEDTSGKGHISRIVDGSEQIALFLPVPEGVQL